MYISPTVILSKICISMIIFIIQYFLLKYLNKYVLINTKIMVLLSLLFVLILGLPLEFPFTISLPSKVVMPLVYNLLEYNLFSGFKILHFLLILWSTGIVFNLGRFIYNYRKILNFIKLCSNELICTEIDGRKIHVLKIDKESSPFVIGLFKPIVILPSLQLTEKDFKFILKHECIHISNRDLFIKYFYELFVIIYWWNPAVYLFRNHVNQILEIRTDEILTSSYNIEQRFDYIETLIKVSEAPHFTKRRFSVSFTVESKELLLQRSRNILSKKTVSQNKLKKRVLFVSILSLFYLAVSAITFEPYFIQPNHESMSFEITPQNSYLIKKHDEYLLYVNGKYITTIINLDNDDNLKKLKIISEKGT